ncbi:MAG: carbohydrate ABC transporter permease [Chloroflexi bacterium]|nr:carbohydrate ABC transporter permease [Chloroflexota bacterium]
MALRKISFSLIIRYLVALLIALLVLVPLAMTVFGGLKSTGDLLSNPIGWPDRFHWENFDGILQSASFWLQMRNSLFVMLASALGVVLLASMPAFIFARTAFRGREIIFNFFTIGLLFPLAVAILPLYISLRQLLLIDSHWGIILPQIAFGLPGTILILRGFFAGLPQEIEDAAYIDGCTTVGFFWHVALPLVRPALAAVFVLAMVGSWNAFFLPLLVLNKENLWTLPLGILRFQGQWGTDWARILAFVSLTLIPTIGFYFFAERHIVTGLTAGAVKG